MRGLRSRKGAVDREGRELDLPRHARARRRRHAAGASSSLDLDGHSAIDDAGRQAHVRAGPARDRRHVRDGFRPAPEDVIYYRTLDDYRRLRELAGDGSTRRRHRRRLHRLRDRGRADDERLRRHDRLPGAGIGSRLFPAELVVVRERLLPREGRRRSRRGARPGSSVGSGDAHRRPRAARAIEADAVVAGLGIVPNTELAEAAGLEVDDGILVDEYGRAGGRDDVFAAGDVARFPVAGARRHAARRARGPRRTRTDASVGANMAGAGHDRTTTCRSSTRISSSSATRPSETSTPGSRRSSTGPSRTARASSSTSTTTAGPRGVLLWDVWGKVDDARGLILAGTPVMPRVAPRSSSTEPLSATPPSHATSAMARMSNTTYPLATPLGGFP